MAINDISLTAGMRSNLLSLQNTVNLLDRTQSRLSTGRKINTAIDNPVSFFASQALNARASIIDSLKDAMGQAVQTITAADKGISALSSMIEQAKGLAQSAQSAEAGTTPTAITAGAATISAVELSTMSVEFGAGLTDGATVTVGGEIFTFTTAAGVPADGTFNDVTELAAAINANATLGTAGYVATAGLISNTNADVVAANIVASAEADATTTVTQQHSETWSITANATPYTFTGAGDTEALSKAAAAAGLQTALLAGADVNTATVTAANVVNVTFDYEPSDEMTSLVEQYNTLRTQMDALAEDSGYKGKNLLSAGTILTVKFEGANLAVNGFDASTGTGGLDITAADADIWGVDSTKIDDAITSLDDALVTLRSESSKMAGNLSIITVRQDFSTNMINTLNAGSDKLVLADANEEGANMLMLQTRQSLSTTALSLSAQAAQSVLRLFQ